MITREDVKHIAMLARIELNEDEEKTFEKELSTILSFIGKLSELDTSRVEPMTGGTLERNVMRNDENTTDALQERSEDILNAAADHKDGWVRVKKVFE